MESNSSGSPSSSKQTRRRVKTKRFDFDYLDNEDQRLLQQVKSQTKYFINSSNWDQCKSGLENIVLGNKTAQIGRDP